MDYTSKTIFETDSFNFCKVSGIGVNNTPYETYEVKTKRSSKMDDYCIEVRIHFTHVPFNGTPVVREAENITINYGLPGKTVSVTGMCELLQEAIIFAERVSDFLKVPLLNK